MQAFFKELDALKHLPLTKLRSIKAVQKATGQKGKKLFMPIRVA